MSPGKIYMILLVLLQYVVSAQDSLTASLPKVLSWYRQEKIIGVRGGVGIQKNAFVEAGLSYHTNTYGCMGCSSNGFYTAVEFMPQKNKNVFGFKAGYELTSFFLAAAIEAKYQTDFYKNDVVITPRIGLSLCSSLFVYYGYNISFNKNPFNGSGHHQLSFIANLPAIRRPGNYTMN